MKVKKQQLRSLMGENIRLERLARDMSIDELAEQLELTPGFVGLIERGHRGATSTTLFKLSQIFSMPIDNFFYRSEAAALSLRETPLAKRAEGKRKKIASLIREFSEAELDFVVRVVKGVREMTHQEESQED